MIILSFRALNGESVMLIRGTYFRICADGTLRGPDNAVAARYTDGLWQLGRKRHRTLECREAIYLRVTTSDGQRECIGPYEYLKVAGGDIFSNNTYLGAHSRGESCLPETGIWKEVALLSDLDRMESVQKVARYVCGTAACAGNPGLRNIRVQRDISNYQWMERYKKEQNGVLSVTRAGGRGMNDTSAVEGSDSI